MCLQCIKLLRIPNLILKIGKKMKEEDSVSDLLMQSNQLHEDIINIYKEQIRDLKIKIAILEEENNQLKKG